MISVEGFSVMEERELQMFYGGDSNARNEDVEEILSEAEGYLAQGKVYRAYNSYLEAIVRGRTDVIERAKALRPEMEKIASRAVENGPRGRLSVTFDYFTSLCCNRMVKEVSSGRASPMIEENGCFVCMENGDRFTYHDRCPWCNALTEFDEEE